MTIIKKTEDEAVRKEIEEALVANDGYCPCRVGKLPENKCMCKEFRDTTAPGPCHCGLFVKVDMPD